MQVLTLFRDGRLKPRVQGGPRRRGQGRGGGAGAPTEAPTAGGAPARRVQIIAALQAQPPLTRRQQEKADRVARQREEREQTRARRHRTAVARAETATGDEARLQAAISGLGQGARRVLQRDKARLADMQQRWARGGRAGERAGGQAGGAGT